ncbi:hypothetical protein H0266_05910 [Halobacillus locisalis]|uniref:DUF4825 domain-containing protein n=1 Tax=Halobacillus locisalis TaxID=220753 RepID=A0A838CR17_9BACI|nr:hypothetical protein [Halobacillus locisalis]MBA2174440.1 hypothetical protein [Halobacillus locisalis]
MKKWVLILMFWLTGCSQTEEITTIKDMTFQNIHPYIGTYVGGNQHPKILRSLPAGEMIGEIRTDDGRVHVDYRYKESFIPGGSFYEYWREEGQKEQTFIYNAIMLSLLIPDSKGYHFTLNGDTASIERVDLMKRFAEEFDEFSEYTLTDSDIVLFKEGNKERMASFLSSNMNEIAEFSGKATMQKLH